MLSFSKIKPIIALVLVFTLSLATICSTPAPEVKAKTTSQMRNELEELEEKSAKIEKEIAALKKQQASQEALRDALRKQIDATEEEIAACTSIIDEYKEKISKLEAEIAAKEAEMAEAKETYRQRIRSVYMSGNVNSDLLVLLESDNLSDYLSLAEIAKRVSAHDQKLLDSITADIKVINEKKADINAQLSEQNSVKKTLASKQAKLKTQRAEINGIIAGLESDKDTLEAKGKEYEKAIAKLEDEIQAALNSASNSGSNPVFTSGTFTWPVPGYYNITSYYGYRVHPISGKYKLHGGIDIASSGIAGKPIVASADGVVIAAGYNTGGFGNWVMINHGNHGGNQFATVYAHMKYSPVVSNGQSVKAGQTLGYVGSTGASTGNHLHFEIRVNGDRTNPLNYFSKVK